MITVHVKEVALKRGFKNPRQLALQADVPPNLAVRVWNNEFERIDKGTLDKLCRALKCQPSLLLKYVPSENDE